MALTGPQLLGAIKKHPVGSTAIVVAVACAATIYFRSDIVTSVAANLERASAESERFGANIKNAAQLPEQAAALDEAMTAIDARLIRAADLGENLKYFYGLEAITGAKITELRQTGAVAAPAKGPKPIFTPVGFTLSLQGSYTQVLEFLRQVENGAHFARVMAATLSNPPESLDKATHVNLQLNVELLGKS